MAILNRFLLHYDVNGNINKIITQIGLSNLLWDYAMDMFGCNANTGYITYWATYQMDGSAWSLSNEIIKHINGSFLPDTVLEFTRGSWMNDTSWKGKKTVFTYNAYDNPETAILFLEDTAGVWSVTPYSTHYYYYEEYQDMSKASGAVYENRTDIYPNPATGYIFLQTEKQNMLRPSVIFNARGQPVKTVTNPESNISIKELSNGICFIKIVFKDGNYTVKKLIADK